MERRIKFRGWNDKHNKWLYGYYANSQGFSIIIEENYEERTLEDVLVNKKTVGQYTGLKDKNGKEIYEGDIVKGVSHKSDSCISELIPFDVIGVVGYHKEYQTLEVRTRQASLHIEVAIKGEVIGNIHDNPELLKGGK